MNSIISLSNISVELNQKSILKNISFSLAAGDILGLVGPSGCGKTTLLNTIAGFIKQAEGDIEYSNYPTITKEQFLLPEHRQIGVIFQDYALFPHLTVAKNIAFGIQHIDKVEQKERVGNLLTLLKIAPFADRFPHQLSGGQQQRVAIARALAPQTKLLLLDEPFSNIDARLRNELMLELRVLLKQLNMTAIFVTHNKDEVFTFADKIAVLNEGEILQFGRPSDVCQLPNSWQVADFLQLGSWIPVTCDHGRLISVLGVLPTQPYNFAQANLLVKPQDIELNSKISANCEINHINITEHGYHYMVSSLVKDSNLSFKRLSFYSQDLLSLGQEVALTIKPHRCILFEK